DVGTITNASDGTDIGSVEGFDNTRPFVEANTLTDVTSTLSAPYSFNLTFDDETGVDPSSLATGVIQVVGQGGGFTVFPSLVGTPTIGLGNRLTATYQFNPPGGLWDVLDSGLYFVKVVANKLTDTDGTTHFGAAQTVGNFRVAFSIAPSVYQV